MKILITGGAGFIGSNLCEYFVQNGYEVVCLDNLSTGFKRNIEPLLSKPNFTFLLKRTFVTWKFAHEVRGCDAVLHQAALGSVPRSINNPIATNATNIDGFLNSVSGNKRCRYKEICVCCKLVNLCIHKKSCLKLNITLNVLFHSWRNNKVCE